MCDPRMRDRTVTRLADRGAEIWVAWDTSDLRKPYARALDRTLVPGYLTFTALGMTPDHRGILYHHLTHGNPPPSHCGPPGFTAALSYVRMSVGKGS